MNSVKPFTRNIPGYGVNFKHCQEAARLKRGRSLEEPLSQLPAKAAQSFLSLQGLEKQGRIFFFFLRIISLEQFYIYRIAAKKVQRVLAYPNQFPLLLIPCVGVVYLSQLLNQCRYSSN